MNEIQQLIESINEKKLIPEINLDRPKYVQPEDSIFYRAMRILIVLGTLNKKTGLSKNVIACIDFLLRNEPFQSKFVIEYFSGQKNIINKVKSFNTSSLVEIDYNIVQYKSVPWDIRYNDMFLFLFVRDYIKYSTDKNNKNLRISISLEGMSFYQKIITVFPKELNFLDLFGTNLAEKKTVKIITEVIPNSYWKQNVKINNK